MIAYDVNGGMSRFEEELLRIVTAAGDMIRSARADSIEEKEGHANFVTNVDQAVERHLKDSLLALLPGAAFIGEEQENAPLTAAPTWIVDPLDGTTNFIHDYRFSAVSVALAQDGVPVLAAVYQPYTDEMFFAKRGFGATLNGAPIRTANHDLAHALVAFGTSPYDAPLAKKSLHTALRFLQSAADLRRSGSAALDLAYVACGRQDVFFELSLKPWDYAAGALLVQEAGGTMRMPLLAAPDYGRITAVLAANGACSAAADALFDACMQEDLDV